MTARLPPPKLIMGAMRLSTAPDRDDVRAREVLAKAVEHGVVGFDTARAYAHNDDELGHNERLLAPLLRERPGLWIASKVGMRRPHGRWVPCGKKRAILEDAEATAEALGRPPDLLFLHAPDPTGSLKTSARALAEAQQRGLAAAVGLSNVSATQVAEVDGLVDVAGLQLGLSRHDDKALRGGLLDVCRAKGIPLLAHSPLGGPPKARKGLSDIAVEKQAERLGLSPAQLVLAWLAELDPQIHPVVGPTRTATAVEVGELAQRLAQRAPHETLLDDEVRSSLDAGFPAAGLARLPSSERRPPPTAPTRVHLIMGIQGAGKSTLAASLTSEGVTRLNRDDRGGRIRDLLLDVTKTLVASDRGLVLDNTYPTRAVRNELIETAWTAGAHVACTWLKTGLDDALVNAAQRLIERYGHLPSPEELKALQKSDPHAFDPRTIFRLDKLLEPPVLEEGYVELDVVPFERRPWPSARSAWVMDLDPLDLTGNPTDDTRAALERAHQADIALLGLAWRPRAQDEATLRQELTDAATATCGVPITVGVCVHEAGPPRCWCRKPLPGRALELLLAAGADPGSSTMIVHGPADRTLGRRLGLLCRSPDEILCA